MSKDELITKQQLEIEEYRVLFTDIANVRDKLMGQLFSIGAPLNDNRLQFNAKQRIWCHEVASLVDQLPEKGAGND